MTKSVSLSIPRETTALSLGADDVAKAIVSEAKKRNVAVTIRRTGSRGACWLEPLVLVEVGEDQVAYGSVDPMDIEGLFDASFLQGGKHAKRIDNIESLGWFAIQDQRIFNRCGHLDPLNLVEYEKAGGLKGLRRALELEPRAIIEEIKTSGLRGRGGAAFPAGIKWKTVHDASGERKYVACNADEGDSGTFSDRMLMEGDPFCLIEGIAIAARAVGASKGYIYLRSEYPLARDILVRALATANEARLLGTGILGSDFDFDIELRIGAGSYVCGEETAMLESLEGKRGQVRAKPPLPAISGLFGMPTLVNNVITLASVPDILASGGKSYAEMGMGRSLGTLPVQLGGNVKRGGLVEVPFGISLRELVEDIGGGTATGRPIKAVQIGGPLGAYLPTSLLDTPLDYEAIAAAGGLLGHGGIVVFDDTVDMVAQARFAMEFCAIESCGKCTPCRIGSVRGVETIDRIAKGEKKAQNLELLEDLCETMEDGSLCAMGGLTPLPVRSAIRFFPQDFGLPSGDRSRSAAE